MPAFGTLLTAEQIDAMLRLRQGTGRRPHSSWKAGPAGLTGRHSKPEALPPRLPRSGGRASAYPGGPTARRYLLPLRSAPIPTRWRHWHVPRIRSLVRAGRDLTAQAPVTRVEVIPAQAEIRIGQTLRLSATARDSSGRALPNVPIRWMGHGEGSVDSTGLLKGGYAGYVHVFAMAAADSTKPVLGEAVIRVLPLPASRIQIQPAPSKLLAGTRLTLSGTPFSAQGDRRNDPVSFSSSAPRVASVTPDGRLIAVAPGRSHDHRQKRRGQGRRSRSRSFPIRRRGSRWSRR